MKKLFRTKGVDICNAKSMFNFINEHFKYYTMNSWNQLKSIANNVKLYNLQLEGDWTTALNFLYDDCDCGSLNLEIRDMIDEWEADHPYYSLGFNGRGGGYLVMYNKDRDGRVNFRNILPEDLTGFDTYEDWKEYIKDCGWNVSDFITTLKEYTKDIREFDDLCDNIRDVVNKYSKMDYEASKQQFCTENGIF